MHRLLLTLLVAALLSLSSPYLHAQTKSTESKKKQSTTQSSTKKTAPKKSSATAEKKTTKKPPKQASKKPKSTAPKPAAQQEKVEPKPASDGASPWLGKPAPSGEKASEETRTAPGDAHSPVDELDEAVGKTKDGRTVYAGTRGGHYYLTESGNRVYVQEFEGAKIIGKTADGQTIYEGPRGGHYYYNANGNKTYVPKNR